MLKKFNLTWEAEVPDKTSQYRVWTSKNFSLYKAGTALQNFGVLSEDCDNSSDLWSLVPSRELDSTSTHDNLLLLEQESFNDRIGHQIQHDLDASAGVCQLVEEGTFDLDLHNYMFILLYSVGLACCSKCCQCTD